MKEREINLFDMFIKMMMHWRGIIIWAVVGALIIGAADYIKSSAQISNSESGNDMYVSFEQNKLLLEEKMTDVQKATVLSVIDDESEYKFRKDYIEKSFIMGLDPYNIPRIELYYKISAEDETQCYILSTVYEDFINGVGMRNMLEEKLGILPMDSGEMVYAQSDIEDINLSENYESSLSSATIKVIIINNTKDECEQVTQCIEQYIFETQELLEEEIGNHEIKLIAKTCGTTADVSLADKQVNYNNLLVTLLNNSAKLKDAFTADQQAYYDLLTQSATEEVEGDVSADAEPAEPVAPAKASVSVKAIAVGAIIGAVLYACAIMFFYVINNRLRASDELTNIYDIPQLGLVVKDNSKLFIVDKWIQSLRNRGTRRFTAEQSLELATTAVKIAALKNGLDNVCLIGCDMEAGAHEVCDKLKESLEKDNLTVTILNNVLYDAAAMAQLDDVKGAVLVEKAGSTMYREIADELELVGRQEIKVLGGIVVE